MSTLNSLTAVYQLHCGGKPLEKATREVFVEGTMEDVRNDFQVSMDQSRPWPKVYKSFIMLN